MFIAYMHYYSQQSCSPDAGRQRTIIIINVNYSFGRLSSSASIFFSAECGCSLPTLPHFPDRFRSLQLAPVPAPPIFVRNKSCNAWQRTNTDGEFLQYHHIHISTCFLAIRNISHVMGNDSPLFYCIPIAPILVSLHFSTFSAVLLRLGAFRLAENCTLRIGGISRRTHEQQFEWMELGFPLHF